jgi:WD40 repeat protein
MRYSMIGESSARLRRLAGCVGGLIVAAGLIWGTSRAPAQQGPPDEDEIRRLIGQLGSFRYKDREVASKRLEAIGAPAWYLLTKAAAGSADLETRRRAEKLVQTIGKRHFVEIRHFGGPISGYWLNRVAFTPDGRQAVATGGGLILYDLQTGKELYRVLELQFARAGLALTRDGRYFLTGHQGDRLVRLGEVATGKPVRAFEGHTGGVWAVALSADGTRAASGSDDGTVRLWDVQTGKELHICKAGPRRVCCVAFSPDGRSVLSGHDAAGSSSPVYLWDVETGKELHRFTGHTGNVSAVAFLPDGRSFLSASTDGTVRQWDVKTGKELRRMEHRGGVNDLAIAPDGRRALSAGFGDRMVRLWDLADGGQLFCYEGHQGAVLGVAFSRDGRLALSCDSQYTVRLWRLPEPDGRPAGKP